MISASVIDLAQVLVDIVILVRTVDHVAPMCPVSALVQGHAGPEMSWRSLAGRNWVGWLGV